MKLTEKERMEAWTGLDDPKPSWETFKRMMPMFKNNPLVVRTLWIKNVTKNQPLKIKR
jgi:pyruvate-formate lyase-activating enzyme